MSLDIATEANPAPTPEARRAEILADPGFGIHFTDHMYVAEWTPDAGWHNATVKPYGPFQVDPAMSVLHYAQEIFEGMKAYRHADGSIWTFRPEANAQRFQKSATRLALPQLGIEDFLASLQALVEVDREWVPSGEGQTLYLRPFMFASEVFLGVRPAKHVTYSVIASPAGPYFHGGVKPVKIWLSEEFNRAGPGGTGAAKCGGNYAASLLPQSEAADNGCEQVVFLDAAEYKYLEELGGMNVFLVYADGTIVTPDLDGSILEGVTRRSIIEIADEQGHKIDERRVAVEEWKDGVRSGDITEVFACGTAAVVTPVSELRWRGGSVSSGAEAGQVTMDIRNALLDIQFGRVPDRHNWLHRLA
jgi:branched-chain amino acid aminotransferase